MNSVPVVSARKISSWTGVAIVVANMIGTGVFTSLGFQLKDISNLAVVLTLWIAGGLLALSGAFSYAEVGTAIRESGGEYTFLSRLYHPVVGYLSGWVSLTTGFAAPIALASIASVKYFPFGNLDVKWTAIVLLAIITFIHSHSLKVSALFQNSSTLMKVFLIVLFISIGLALPGNTENHIYIRSDYFKEIGSAAFAVSLIYVSYSYSGWNAAVYITEEFKNPVKSLSVALIGGTVIVTVLYTLLQFVFLKHAPVNELVGELNVGTVVARRMLGDQLGNIFGLIISLLLISGISAMVWIGSRITSSMAKAYSLWRHFNVNKNEIPQKALWLQFSISSVLLLTGTFEQILIYCGILITLSSVLTVCGVFLLRRKNTHDKKVFKSPLYPLFQILFLLISLWMIGFAFIHNYFETIIGMINLLIGLGTYLWSKRIKAPKIEG